MLKYKIPQIVTLTQIMEHFKRLAFCMLYLFTFIWQLSAQVKKIPQWGAVRDSVARYCQRNFISDVAGDNINKKPLLLQWFFSCRNEATRTPDPYVPNVVRYQLRYIPIPFSKSGATRNRTGDTRIFSPLLYQLSYGTLVLRCKDRLKTLIFKTNRMKIRKIIFL